MFPVASPATMFWPMVLIDRAASKSSSTLPDRASSKIPWIVVSESSPPSVPYHFSAATAPPSCGT
jgi:hypothetical protein